MNSTHWLLVAIALTLALALAVAYVVARLNDAKSAPEYRTADGGVLESDVQALQQLVPSPRPRVRAGACSSAPSPVTSLDKAYMAVLAQAKASGEAAGMLQAQGGPGWPKAANPYKPGSRAYLVWMTSCEAALEAKAAADAHHAHNQRTAA